jgi:hypothetical protein
METATLVEEIRSFQTEDASADQDTPRILAEYAHFLVVQTNSPIKEDVQCAHLTLSIRLKSTAATALTVNTRIFMEYASN